MAKTGIFLIEYSYVNIRVALFDIYNKEITKTRVKPRCLCQTCLFFMLKPVLLMSIGNNNLQYFAALRLI